MDWNSIVELAGRQGMVFWIASAAISLGLTLLAAALVQGLRQKRRALRPRSADAATSAPAPVPAAPQRAQDAASAPATAAAAAAYRAVEPRGEDDGSLALLLRRLQSAGDRLEEVATDLEAATVGVGISGLKSSLQDVEYVFKAGES